MENTQSFEELWAELKFQLNLTDHDLENQMKPLVIYHANCADGFGAAYAAWTHLGDHADYAPANYGDCVISADSILIGEDTYVVTDRWVYILDYSLPVSEMHLLMKICPRVIWLDHHKTAIENWVGKGALDEFVSINSSTNIRLNNEKSGCRLAWEFFHTEEPPMGLRHIEDWDLWRFTMADTKAYCEGLRQVPQNFEAWEEVMHSPDLHWKTIRVGETLLKSQAIRINKVAHGKLNAITLHDNEGTPHTFNSINVCNDISETGNAICLRTGLPSATFFVNLNEVVISLRSEGDFDVSRIAKHYGGGGHKNAAGFKMNTTIFFNTIWK